MSNDVNQRTAIQGREEDMATNNAGGVVFKISPWDQLDRFLILGTEGGTYYSGDRELTQQNAQNVHKLIRTDGKRVVERVVEISDSGRAPKNDPALFVLAMASAADDLTVRQAALEALPKVARIGTHLFHYAAFVEGFRGWGRALRRAVANWYLDMPLDRLANQVIKYQQRDGWSNRDLIRLAHPQTNDPQREAIIRWATGGLDALTATPHKRGLDKVTVTNRADVSNVLHPQILAFEAAKTADEAETIRLIQSHNLPREAIATQHLNSAAVWEALLENMPMTAMIRNLATMTRNGLLQSGSAAEAKIQSQLADADVLRKARVHPITLLSALLTYSSGRSARGSSTWTPVDGVVKALDSAFYGSFGNVTPTGKSTLLALDVSGSMAGQEIANLPGLNARIASAAMALITANVEPDYDFIGFTTDGWSATAKTRSGYWGGSSVSRLAIKPSMRLDDVIRYINGLGFSGTDCSLPILWAQNNKIPHESFSVYTDNETYAGTIQPSQALTNYRQTTGIPAKLAVVGMTATGFTIADPKDRGMLDIVGFDTNAPQLMSDFFAK